MPKGIKANVDAQEANTGIRDQELESYRYSDEAEELRGVRDNQKRKHCTIAENFHY